MGETISKDSGSLLFTDSFIAGLCCCRDNLWCLQVIFTAWLNNIPCWLQTIFSFLSLSLVLTYLQYWQDNRVYTYLWSNFPQMRMITNGRLPMYLCFQVLQKTFLYQSMSCWYFHLEHHSSVLNLEIKYLREKLVIKILLDICTFVSSSFQILFLKGVLEGWFETSRHCDRGRNERAEHGVVDGRGGECTMIFGGKEKVEDVDTLFT